MEVWPIARAEAFRVLALCLSIRLARCSSTRRRPGEADFAKISPASAACKKLIGCQRADSEQRP